MVDMHYIVAHLDLAEFFQRQGEFARAGAVALQSIFVESVEDLVISEDAYLGLVVDEAFVKGAVDCVKQYFVATVGENLS